MKTNQTKITLKNYSKLNFEKAAGFVTAVVQNADTRQVLMVGYMTREAVKKTLMTKRVTFFSRSKNRLWTKGETSKNYLDFLAMYSDCDGDALLILAQPEGPTCHTGTQSCFVLNDREDISVSFFDTLQKVIDERRRKLPKSSYTTELFESGLKRIAQKVGEEAVEVVIVANGSKDRLISESADLIYHLLVLLSARGASIGNVEKELWRRSLKKS